LPAENQTVNPSFNIQSPFIASQSHLFVFAGWHNLAFAILNTSTNIFSGVIVYHFTSDISDEEIYNIFKKIVETENILKEQYAKTDIIWQTEKSIITPEAFFNPDENTATLNLIFGDAGNYSDKYELILKEQAYNVYRADAGIEKLITDLFPAAVQSHQASLITNIAAEKNNLFYCYFSSGSITVMLRKENKLQVTQTFYYNTPEDAVYYILNTCQQFNVNPANTCITVSGMIDEASNLYKQLYKYFSVINFSQLPDVFNYTDEIKAYPPHYFSHLFATAACVL
jgi:Protein of unknown function (DUF3822)